MQLLTMFERMRTIKNQRQNELLKHVRGLIRYELDKIIDTFDNFAVHSHNVSHVGANEFNHVEEPMLGHMFNIINGSATT